MCLVETCQVNGFCPFNVPDMFPPVSRGPRPQWECLQEIEKVNESVVNLDLVVGGPEI